MTGTEESERDHPIAIRHGSPEAVLRKRPRCATAKT